MTIYYVDPSATSGTQDGLTKANAFLTLAAAFAVAINGGDEIRCAHDKMDVVAADTTYNIAANKLSVLSWNFATDQQEIGFSVGHLTLNRSLTFKAAASPASGQRMLRIYGIAFIVSGSTADSINLFTAYSGLAVFWESCSFVIQNTNTTCRLKIGGGGEYEGIQFFLGCYFSRAKAAQTIVLGDHRAHFQNCEFRSIVDTFPANLFSSLEQGPDTLLESCYVYGYFNSLIGGAVTGTRAVRMIEGNWTANQWPNYGLASTGMWGFEQEFRDVCLSSWSTGETAKYSAILAPGRVYEFCIPENPDSSSITKWNDIYISQQPASPDVVAWARPIAKIKAKQPTDYLPSFWRMYVIGYDPLIHGERPICITAQAEFSGANSLRNLRLTSFNVFDPARYSPELIEETEISPALQEALDYEGYTTAHYFDVPMEWLTRGAGPSPYFVSLESWELTVGIHLGGGVAFILFPYIYVEAEVNPNLQVAMEGGVSVQTLSSSGGSSEPIPGYKALVVSGGQLVQADVTLNEPPTGIPVVWDGTILRTLAPGESVVLQNP